MTGVNRCIPFVFAALFLQSCSQQEPIAPATQTLQFSFALEGNHSELPAGSIVVFSITTPSGSPVVTDHEVAVTAVDDGFITEPISLKTSQYLLTEFMIMHDGAAIYVSPKASSERAQDVNTPLSYALTLPNDKVVRLQVVETRDEKAEKFGYTSLARKASGQWKIMVFTREDGAMELSRAWTYLRAPGISYGSEVEAQMNTLPFQGDPTQTYTLIVEKAGYETYTTDFVYNDIAGNGNKPFKVVLDRVPNENTFTITPPLTPGGEYTFNLGLRGTGSLTIDWSDGNIQTINFAPDGSSSEPDASHITVSHQFGGEFISKQISISGDLDKIFLFENESVYASHIDLRNLTALEDVTLYGFPINGLLDLSQNSQLESLRIEATYAWEIRLPESHKIADVYLDEGGIMSQDVVDGFIENIYSNAIAQNILSGSITIRPPTALSTESQQRLQELAEEYDWEIHLE